MSFNPERFETMFGGGSLVAFKKLDRPPLSEPERELESENTRDLESGISVLRKMRTQALEVLDVSARQNILSEAHQFSAQMADAILNRALAEKPSRVSTDFLDALQKNRGELAGLDAGSGRGLPTQNSVGNLLRATDDMLVRIQEKAGSFRAPDHKLAPEEMKYVLQNFLTGTNNLDLEASAKFFEKGTKVGGILSGGSVYLELVKKIEERYGDPSLAVDSFVIAVDKHNGKAVFEASESDATAESVIVTDDMIDKGGTLLTALWAAGEQFPKATIHSGKETDYPGGFEKRRVSKHMAHLETIFQDFAVLAEEGQNENALTLFTQAEQYAVENKVTLPRGFYSVKERLDKQKREG